MSRRTRINTIWIVLAAALFCPGASPKADPQDRNPSERVLRLGSVEIKGNKRTSDEVIHRFLDLRPGDVIDVDVFDAARERLLDSDYFSSVNFSTRRGSTRGTVVLRVDVKERGFPSFETGYGYHDVHGWFLTLLGLRFDNVLVPESRLRVGWRVGFRLQGVDAQWEKLASPGERLTFALGAHAYQQDHLFFNDTPVPTGATDADKLRRFEQNIARIGFDATLRYRFNPHSNLSAGAKFERIDPDSTFTDAEFVRDFSFNDLPSVLQDDIEERNINGVFLRFIRDTRDDLSYPRSGSFSRAALEANTTLLGSDEAFVKGTLDIRKHFAVGRRSSFAVRGAGGLTEKNTPYYDRFYVGGNYSVRGFEEWSLSPTEGDDGYWLVSQELRFPLTLSGRGQPRVTGLVFLDVGQGWRWEDEYTGDDVESAAGYGVRIKLPWVGTLGIDAAVPFSPGRTGDVVRAHLSLGYSF